MNILKIGKSHTDAGLNCQDATEILGNELKIVCDGCSQGLHSEVGAKLFVRKFVNKYDFCKKNGKRIDIKHLIECTMDELVCQICDLSNVDDLRYAILNYLSFTLLVAHKGYDGSNKVYVCGDGYIILQSRSNIEFKKIDNGEYPKYYAYNYVPATYLQEYKGGVDIEEYAYVYDDDGFLYRNVGVASDGIRFIVDLPKQDERRIAFKDILKAGKNLKMNLFINRNQNICQDDISIAF